MIRLFFLWCILLGTAAVAQRNPFLSSPEAREHAADTVCGERIAPDTYRTAIPFPGPVLEYQKRLTAALSGTLHALKTRFSPGHAVLLMLIAFVYGIVHALGPGHAKMIIGSYMLSTNRRIRDSFAAGTIFAGMHTGMALLVFMIFTLVLNIGSARTQRASGSLFAVSGVFVAIIGSVMLFQALFGERQWMRPVKNMLQRRSLAVLSAAAGIMPCPGALLLLVFSRLIGKIQYGVISVLFLSAGMAVTVSSVAAAGIYARRAMLVHGTSRMYSGIATVLRITGSAAITLIGISMIAM